MTSPERDIIAVVTRNDQPRLGAFAAGIASSSITPVCIGSGDAPVTVPPVLWHQSDDTRSALLDLRPQLVVVDSLAQWSLIAVAVSEATTNLHVPCVLLAEDANHAIVPFVDVLITVSEDNPVDAVEQVRQSTAHHALVVIKDMGLFHLHRESMSHHEWDDPFTPSGAAKLGMAIAALSERTQGTRITAADMDAALCTVSGASPSRVHRSL